MEREKPSLGLIIERMPKVISVPCSNKRVELKMGTGNGMLITNLGTVWKLLRPSWCPHPHASLIEGVTERVMLTPTKDEDLRTLNVIHKLILPQSKESGGAMVKLGSLKKLERGSCLDLTCGGGELTCDGRSCVIVQSFQREDLVAWFGEVTERMKSEAHIVSECYTHTIVNIATALGFFSRMCSLQSLEMLESEHHLVTALARNHGLEYANNSEAHQRAEAWPCGGNGISHKRGLNRRSYEETSERITAVPGGDRR